MYYKFHRVRKFQWYLNTAREPEQISGLEDQIAADGTEVTSLPACRETRCAEKNLRLGHRKTPSCEIIM